MPRKDPNTLPAVAGTVERLVPGPKGEAEGRVLTDPAGRSRLVRFPPHLAREVEVLVRPGEFVAVRGETDGKAGATAGAALTPAEPRPAAPRRRRARGGCPGAEGARKAAEARAAGPAAPGGHPGRGPRAADA